MIVAAATVCLSFSFSLCRVDWRLFPHVLLLCEPRMDKTSHSLANPLCPSLLDDSRHQDEDNDALHAVMEVTMVLFCAISVQMAIVVDFRILK